MSTPSTKVKTIAHERRPFSIRLLLFGGVVAVVLLVLAILSLKNSDAFFLTGGGSMIVLAVPVFLVGMLSFMSPCTLPILPAYFAFTFQSNRQNIVLMTAAFFLGLATTMTLAGATATAVGGLLADYEELLTFWGGLIIIGFGLMSLLGKGFAGPQVQERPVSTVAGSYLYGATFALGWTACIGPIIGSLFTLLASQGIGIIQGAVLAFVYAMGMGLPLILLATFFSRLGTGSRFWQIMRGRGFTVSLGSSTLHLHSTSIISGLLLIVMGWLLASGQLSVVTAMAEGSPMGRWFVNIEESISCAFALGCFE